MPISVVAIVGDLGDNDLVGSTLADSIFGDGLRLQPGQRGGDDGIKARDGDDTVYGDARVLVGASGGDDHISGGDGDDRLYGDGAVVTQPITLDMGEALGIAISIAFMGSDEIDGGKGDDQIWGDAASNGRAVVFGNDILRGGSGDDIIHGDGAGPSVVINPPPPGVPTALVIRQAADTLHGGKGDDRLFGDAGNDVLKGGAGCDWLDGGAGFDQLTGGKGADTFVLRVGSGSDVITDFHAGEDRILILRAILSSSADAVQLHATPGGLQVSYGDGGDAMLLQGVTVLHPGDIVFG